MSERVPERPFTGEPFSSSILLGEQKNGHNALGAQRRSKALWARKESGNLIYLRKENLAWVRKEGTRVMFKRVKYVATCLRNSLHNPKALSVADNLHIAH